MKLTRIYCGAGENRRRVTSFSEKGLKTFHAARILCVHGCGADALALCASLFENLVDLLYVRQEPEPRASAYIAFEQVDKYYQARKVLRHTDLTEEERKTHEAHLNSLTPQVEKHLGMFPTQSCWWKSSGKSSKRARVTLRDRAEAVGLDKRYDTLYYIFCSHKHTRASAAAGFMYRHGEGVDVILGPNVKGVYNAAQHSTMFSWTFAVCSRTCTSSGWRPR